ncbi:hypothetical protein HN876_00555 [archaeon]|nr:hypothetical protein [archaeon]MBT7251391.1 hypothetical protein [archaeon]
MDLAEGEVLQRMRTLIGNGNSQGAADFATAATEALLDAGATSAVANILAFARNEFEN